MKKAALAICVTSSLLALVANAHGVSRAWTCAALMVVWQCCADAISPDAAEARNTTLPNIYQAMKLGKVRPYSGEASAISWGALFFGAAALYFALS